MPTDWIGYTNDSRTWEEREKDAMRARRRERRRTRRANRANRQEGA